MNGTGRIKGSQEAVNGIPDRIAPAERDCPREALLKRFHCIGVSKTVVRAHGASVWQLGYDAVNELSPGGAARRGRRATPNKRPHPALIQCLDKVRS